MFCDVEAKIKKRNKILFSRESACLKDAIWLIGEMTHRQVVMWSLDCAKEALCVFEEKYPKETRPRTCINLCKKWSRGEKKMPEAKSAILGCHAVAKDIEGDAAYQALCHAIAHAGAAIHVETHAAGLMFYELTYIVLKNGCTGYESEVKNKIDYYMQKLSHYKQSTANLQSTWAKFLTDDTRPNKEKLLRH